MTTTVLIRPGEHTRHADLIEESYRLRHKIFVEERGWRDLERADGREVDKYDNTHATYILAIDGGRVVGGQRFYPTTRPHMISEVFAHLVTVGHVPSSPSVMEWTRYFVVKERRMGRTDAHLLAAMQRFMLDEGMRAATAIAEMWWLPRLDHYGFQTTPLGLPQMVGGQWTVALSLKVSGQTLRHIIEASRILPPAFAPNRQVQGWEHYHNAGAN